MRETRFKNKLVLGLTGGVGAGKSTVMGILQQEYGALILEADRICNALIEPEGSQFQRITELLGAGVLGPSGEIDRGKMAALIFQDRDMLKAVNAILHPATFREVERRIRSSRKKLIVYESAIPYEARFSSLCDRVLYVYASPAVRRERLKATRGYSDEKISAIFLSQPEEALYYQLADGVVNNEGDRESCRHSLARILEAWGLEGRS